MAEVHAKIYPNPCKRQLGKKDMRDNVTEDDGGNPNAISLFGQSANANDFPVLKAFQEYVEALKSYLEAKPR